MNKVELLAPAGGPEQFKAAVNAGADAIYLGGSLFNARIGAGNFTLEEMKEALDYGHLRGVRIYVTLNTLMNDDDIPKALKYASKLYELGVDALIIQDFGLGEAIRTALPDFELHLSTQATIYSPEGVTAAKELGYKRTVLSRECSLEEMRSCAEAGEVEVFVHGALCICYSGQCQLSRFIGGRSGNKGMCAQPCRLPYTYLDSDGNQLPGSNPLSPKDLCLIDHIGELIEAGVASFKIEGRMKSPEYVATVVSIYRKYIDEYYNKGVCAVSEEDHLALLQAFNRSGFTEGYLFGDPGDPLMTAGISKNSGVPVGQVIRNSGGSTYVDAYLTSDVKMHDVLEIRTGTYNTSFKVTSIRDSNGRTASLGDVKDKVFKGNKIYRLISQDLLSKAADTISRPRKMPVEFFLIAKIGEPLKMTAKDTSHGFSFSIQDPEIIVQAAQKRAMTEDDILKQLKKTGDTAFYLHKAQIIADDNIFIQVAALNSLRRRVLKGLEDEMISSFDRKIEGPLVMPAGSGEGYLYHDTMDDIGEDAIILPQITKGPYNQWIRDNLVKLAEKARENDSPAVVSNIEWIRPLAGSGVKVIGGPGLNITNKMAVKALTRLGMSEEFVTSPELLDKKDMDGVPLMITEHRLTPGTLTDRRGARYSVEYDESTHKSYIFKG